MSFISEYKQVNKLVQEKHQVIFYAESRHYYQYFTKLISDLLANDIRICYITSDKSDSLLTKQEGRMEVVYVKWLLGFLFSKIKADVMIMTMPDFGNFLFKRSNGVGTYIYMFHAAVSTHQQYRKAAFYNYDAIFCVGAYQEKEIRFTEELYKQKQKKIIGYGYPLLDEINSNASILGKKPAILVAPSWFEGCIFDVCIDELLVQLSKLSCTVTLRSHPEYEKRNKKSFKGIQKLVSEYPGMTIDLTPNVIDSLPSTDILITDRSGIALEFAFGTGRPVLFIETVLKQANPDWQELNIEPIENAFRPELGIAILPSELEKLPEKIRELERMTNGFPGKMAHLKKSTFYNSVASYKDGLDFVRSKII